MTPEQRDVLTNALADEEVCQVLRSAADALVRELLDFGFNVDPEQVCHWYDPPEGRALGRVVRFQSADSAVRWTAEVFFEVALTGTARLLQVLRADGQVRVSNLLLSCASRHDWTAKRHALAILKGELDVVSFFKSEAWVGPRAAELVAELQP